MQPARLLFALLIATLAMLAAQAPSPPAAPAPRPAEPVTMVVVDPAHGGVDSGARGAAGILEKDVALHFGLFLRDELQRQGVRAVLTRYGGENPTYDERAAVANSYRGAVFISLHVASTGPPETARCYFDAIPPAAADAAAAIFPGWDRAQEPYLGASQYLASLVQVQLKQKFPNSPTQPEAAPVRPLRNVAGPAIAVEVSSVSVRNREQLDRMAVPLAEAVTRAVAALRAGSGGGSP